ncbi:C-terminal binding protein [Bacillus sp. Marseille-P3661]|uniref:C-terminal binding protein n=1 Tax=Bacillus sp. Marseille-P3661 TaxID=1936234 RepID=UPI000C84D483|nr:C-terminal binding protein [Bacillus sp. Marseille-P3661]
MSKFKVVITDFEFSTLAPEEEVLATVDAELIRAQCKTEDEVIEAAKDADGILNQYAPISRKVLESLPNLKVVSRYGVGVNTVDIAAATENNVIVGNVTDYCMDEVSDHAFALLMSCARKTVVLNNEVKRGNWDFKVSVPIFRLRGRVLGLAGLGRIPQTLAKKAQAFGINVIAYDPFIPEQVANDLNVKLVTLDELCEQSDYISVHTPLMESTRGLIGEKQFKLMKKEAIIINTARGPVIDEQALIKALQDGEIAGAGLDVLEQEPIASDNPLLKMDNVVLNPHAAWYSEEAELELKRKTAQNIADVLAGYYPTYLFNKEVKETVKLKEKNN